MNIISPLNHNSLMYLVNDTWASTARACNLKKKKNQKKNSLVVLWLPALAPLLPSPNPLSMGSDITIENLNTVWVLFSSSTGVNGVRYYKLLS